MRPGCVPSGKSALRHPLARFIALYRTLPPFERRAAKRGRRLTQVSDSRIDLTWVGRQRAEWEYQMSTSKPPGFVARRFDACAHTRMAALQIAAGVDAVLENDVIYYDGLCKVYLAGLSVPRTRGQVESFFEAVLPRI